MGDQKDLATEMATVLETAPEVAMDPAAVKGNTKENFVWTALTATTTLTETTHILFVQVCLHALHLKPL